MPRLQALYDDPIAAARKSAAEARHNPALDELNRRHRDEAGKLDSRLHRESQAFLHDQVVERDHLANLRKTPAGLDVRQKREAAQLHADHKRQRDELAERQKREVTAAKAKGRQ